MAVLSAMTFFVSKSHLLHPFNNAANKTRKLKLSLKPCREDLRKKSRNFMLTLSHGFEDGSSSSFCPLSIQENFFSSPVGSKDLSTLQNVGSSSDRRPDCLVSWKSGLCNYSPTLCSMMSHCWPENYHEESLSHKSKDPTGSGNIGPEPSPQYLLELSSPTVFILKFHSVFLSYFF